MLVRITRSVLNGYNTDKKIFAISYLTDEQIKEDSLNPAQSLNYTSIPENKNLFILLGSKETYSNNYYRVFNGERIFWMFDDMFEEI